MAWLAVVGGLGLVTFARPRLAIGLVLATLPLFAHKASSPWALRLVLLVAALELAYLFHVRKPWHGLVRALRGNPILFLCALYVVASFLSLSSLPVLTLIRKHANLVSILPVSALPDYFESTMRLPERAREYSVISAFLTLQAFLFCLIVWREMTRTPQAGFRFAYALIAGLLVWAVVGILEFYGFVALGELRGFYAADVMTNAYAPRLESVSGNPGWFAQYVVFALPYFVVLLAQETAARLRVALFGLALALVLLVLILTYQRGGWTAASVELCCLAGGSVYAAWQGREGATRRAGIALARTIALLALVIAIAVSLLYLSVKSGAHPGGASALSAYAERFARLTNSPERIQYASAGFAIGKLYPILGGGSESFGLRYRELYLPPDSLYSDTQPKLDPTSAHNVYLQTFAGKGTVGVALLVAICAGALWACVRTMARSGRVGRPLLVSLAMGGVSIVGFLVYGVVQEVFYVHALQILFFFSLGFVAAITDGTLTWPAKARRTLGIALAVAFVLHLGYHDGYPGPARLVRPLVEPWGLYTEEQDTDGTFFRWTTDRAVFRIPPEASTFTLRVKPGSSKMQVVKVVICGVQSGEFALEDHEWHRLQFLLPGSSLKQRVPEVELRIAPLWASAADGRTLGVMVSHVEFR